MRRRLPAMILVLSIGVATTTGCGIRIPTDPDGTLDRVTGGQLRVGASPSGDLVKIDGGEVTGTLADLVEEFAAERDARVVWTPGSEEDLVDDLENGRLDLAVGGMTDATPWADRVSVTRGYDAIPGSGGSKVVVLLPLGENDLQSTLETFLDEEVAP